MTLWRRARVLVGVVLVVFGLGLWRWLARPVVSLRCADGHEPEHLAIGAALGLGHGALGALAVLGPESSRRC